MTILNRRRWIGTSIAASAMGAIHIGMSHATDEDLGYGQVVGDPEAARVGGNVLRNGGNAIAGARLRFAQTLFRSGRTARCGQNPSESGTG